MKKRIGGLLYIGGVLSSLLMGAQAAMAAPPITDPVVTMPPSGPYDCYWCDGSGCWAMTCPPQ